MSLRIRINSIYNHKTDKNSKCELYFGNDKKKLHLKLGTILSGKIKNKKDSSVVNNTSGNDRPGNSFTNIIT